jgi:hypothetical protein
VKTTNKIFIIVDLSFVRNSKNAIIQGDGGFYADNSLARPLHSLEAGVMSMFEVLKGFSGDRK